MPIARVMETGESVVASDAPKDAFLGKRPSVLELGIETLACVPLSSEDRRIGLIYVDGRRQGGVFTDLDLEIFQGPFDLLLTLVLKEEVDLLGVPFHERGRLYFFMNERNALPQLVGISHE